ncbi:MAG: BamA/TamA family outer membrane protein [Bacteroidetes bacterium]|nr:BamA/TamA family outer membrane protein [Bacteroidota bacterium]
MPVILATLVIQACSPTRKVPEGEYLLNRNVIVNNDTNLPDSELEGYVRQKPNRKIFGFWRFHLWIASTVNREKFDPRYNRRLQKRKELNEKRKLEGKKLKNEEPLSISKWLLEVGEAPVIFDEAMMDRSALQIELLLKNNGYFNAVVRDSVEILKKPKMKNAVYVIDAGTAYHIGNVDYDIDDSDIQSLVYSDAKNSLVNSGDLYQTEKLDSERDRINSFLKNKGYYTFVKSYISYTADSAAGNHTVNIKLRIGNPVRRVQGFVDSTITGKHIKYKINNIYVTGDYSIRRDELISEDTLYFDNIHYISEDQLKFKPKAIKPSILVKRGDLYSRKASENTYRRISETKAFKFINVQFKPVAADSSDLLDCEIHLSPKPRHGFTVQTQGTNTAGNLGVALNFIYQNNNLLKGLELFEVRMNGALEVQQIVNDVQGENQTIQEFLPFNTFMFGPEASLQIPKVPGIVKFLGGRSARTQIVTSYNFQQRPDYKRQIFNATYGFTAHPNNKVTTILNPAEINFVSVDLGADFENLLEQSNNLFLKNSYQSQLIAALRFSYIYNSQKVGESRNFFFFQGNFESSGLMLNASRNFYPNPGIIDDKYVIFGVPYSQYVRFDIDSRYYRYVGKSSTIANRLIVGLGIPYNNSSVMPFAKSFFSGGANGLRGWIARSLGPGGYNPASGVRFDQIGDIKLEYNCEYRFPVYKFFESAIFADAGNVWLRRKDESRPLADFRFYRFYKEIAMDAGIGFRFNFDFFIIRLDAAHPIREPNYTEADRWSFGRIAMKRVNFNLGIGYPF